MDVVSVAYYDISRDPQLQKFRHQGCRKPGAIQEAPGRHSATCAGQVDDLEQRQRFERLASAPGKPSGGPVG